jgi:hypothetical protein
MSSEIIHVIPNYKNIYNSIKYTRYNVGGLEFGILIFYIKNWKYFNELISKSNENLINYLLLLLDANNNIYDNFDFIEIDIETQERKIILYIDNILVIKIYDIINNACKRGYFLPRMIPKIPQIEVLISQL